MVQSKIWKSFNHTGRGFVHLHCIEQMIGRTLILNDFTDVPLNNWIHGKSINDHPNMEGLEKLVLKE